MKSSFNYPVIALLLSTLACKSKFDPIVWNQKGVDWQITDVREKMLDDLIGTHMLIGLDTIKLYKLLGDPESSSDSLMTFFIREKSTTNIDPDFIKYLNVYLENGCVTKCAVVTRQ